MFFCSLFSVMRKERKLRICLHATAWMKSVFSDGKKKKAADLPSHPAWMKSERLQKKVKSHGEVEASDITCRKIPNLKT